MVSQFVTGSFEKTEAYSASYEQNGKKTYLIEDAINLVWGFFGRVSVDLDSSERGSPYSIKKMNTKSTDSLTGSEESTSSQENMDQLVNEFDLLEKIKLECKENLIGREAGLEVGGLPNEAVISHDTNSLFTLRDMSTQRNSVQVVKRVAQSLLEGVNFLGQLGIIHRDLRPENCVFDFNGDLKIIGFEKSIFSTDCEGKLDVQKPGYRSPEVLAQMAYGCSLDAFSVGLILHELFMGAPLVDFSRYSDLLARFKYEKDCEFVPTMVEVLEHRNSLGSMPKSMRDEVSSKKMLAPIYKGAEELYLHQNSFANPIKMRKGAENELLNSLLKYDPIDRATPQEALNSSYLTT
jgi:serine/threonine protein kinase